MQRLFVWVVLLAALIMLAVPVAAQNDEDGDGVFPPPQFATEEIIVSVAVTRLNVRSAPEIEEGNIANIVRLGERYPVIGFVEDQS